MSVVKEDVCPGFVLRSYEEKILFYGGNFQHLLSQYLAKNMADEITDALTHSYHKKVLDFHASTPFRPSLL